MSQKVYVTLTTISRRIEKVYETIMSLLTQDYPIDQITLYISLEPFLLDHGIQHIPTELQLLTDLDTRFIISYVENIGSYRKLLPCLRSHWTEDCLIITVDDDKIYPKDMVSEMISYYRQHGERHIVANRAFVKTNKILKNLCHDHCQVKSDLIKLVERQCANKSEAQALSYQFGSEYDFIKIISFCEGNDGVLYHPKFFTPIVYDWKLIKNLAGNHDDFWFKLCALINGHGVICLSLFETRKTRQRENTQTSALHKHINIGSYEKYLNQMVRWFHKHGLLEQGIKLMLSNEDS